MTLPSNKIKLYGFNNLTKNLSFSLYKVHYLDSKNKTTVKNYHHFINQKYSADKLNALLTNVCHAIGGNVLNVAQQDYQPQGASVTLMISEEAQPESLVAHLDKSHLCIHTYPDNQITDNIAIFRADIELSTCGIISPLKVLNYLLETLNPDIAEIDYRVRGMTRDIEGKKLFVDEKVNDIASHFINAVNDKYHIESAHLAAKNLFYAKLRRGKINLDKMLFSDTKITLSPSNKQQIEQILAKELIALASFVDEK